MKENFNSRKELTDSMANAIYHGEMSNEKIAGLLSKLNKDSKSPPNREAKTNEKKVGIFTLRNIDGENCFVRDQKFKADFPYWNKTMNVIKEKSPKKKRVVLLGESVARGWLYEPLHAPAEVLEDILHQHFSQDIEVVDLAVTSINAREILELCEEALALSPDAFVIYAGNNWKQSVIACLTDAEGYEIYRELVSGKPGYAVISTLVSKAFSRMVDIFFIQLKRITSGRNLEMVFIIPAFNLMDFQSSEIEKEMFMPNLKARAWMQARAQGLNFLEKNDLESLAKLAQELIDLNSFHSLGYEWLAKCKLAAGDLKSAKKLLETACQTAIYRVTSTSSRFFVGLKEPIVKNCHANKVHYVTMDEVFEQHLNGGLPDRTLFLDYSHLTIKGIELSMIACAKTLIKAWSGAEAEPQIDSYEIKCDPQMASTAHFLAAMHNNLCGQSFEIIDYHCRKAFEYDKRILSKMNAYIRMSLSKTPWKINKESLAFVGNNLIQMGMFRYEPHAKIHSALLRSIGKILRENNLAEDLDVILLEEHTISGEETDLLTTKYAADSMLCMTELLAKEKGFYSEIKLESKFYFVASFQHSVLAKLTYRVPGGSADKIKLVVNGKLQVELPAHPKWSTHSFDIPLSDLQSGINELSIHWVLPSSGTGKNKPMTSITDLNEVISPVLGEIQALSVREEEHLLSKPSINNLSEVINIFSGEEIERDRSGDLFVEGEELII
ncbi:SGNH/GDSL hydrolase family protein [Niastella populi]|uniref:SGNH hydrolase-type esterase domain-containing protein n=1 Tax=Niastella populi TaxID=550983 RepID=A0A1V9EKE8_9BACT|nr:hypothetical protein [Niastella populi]OQP46414.1 hypothetical protein A4R26_32015 [Niastella populi]